MNVIASSQGTQLLEGFSKLVERRAAVKLYLAHKLAGFFLLSSHEYLRVPSRAGATLHACHSHSFVKLPVSGTVCFIHIQNM